MLTLKIFNNFTKITKNENLRKIIINDRNCLKVDEI